MISQEQLFAWCEAHKAEQLALLKELAAIPSPSHHEEKRAEFIKAWLEKAGAKNVTIDPALNVLLPFGDCSKPCVVYAAHIDVVFPDWAGEGGCPAECERLADPATRAKIVDEINALDRDWSTVMIGGTWHPDTKRYSGKTVAEIISGKSTAGERQPDVVRRMSPGELICSILALDGCKTGGFFFGMSEENLDKILAKPWIVPGSDASLRAPWGPLGADHPHPRAYATMPEFYRRVRALGVSREEAVARMTSVIADRFAIPNRGRLAAGAFADVVVWKEDEFRANATYDDPHQFTSGVKCVMVNGVVPYSDGKFTGNRAGRFLERSFVSPPTPAEIAV